MSRMFAKLKIPLLSLLLSGGALANLSTFAADNADIQSLPIAYRLTYDQVKMPQGASDMGLVGIHSIVGTPSGLYGGLAGYGSVRGSQGGLLVLGIEAGWEYPIFEHLIFDAGMFAGGAGGASSPVGGGLMLDSHADLMYDFGYFSVGPQYSYITFPSGKIRSGRVGLIAETTSFFDFINPEKYGQILNLPANWITHNYFAFYEQNNFQRSGTKNVNGDVQDGVFHSAGFELGHYVTDRVYVAFKTSGAFSGIPSGYMDALGGGGYRFPLTTQLSATAAMYLGVGGGGKVDTGGGLLLQPIAGLQWEFIPQWGLWAEGGYLDAPKGQLRAPTLTLKLYHNFDDLHKKGEAGSLSDYFVNKWRVRIMNQTYFNPKRATSNSNQNINLINVTFDQFLNSYFYLTGGASSAYAGRGQTTGGPATGLVGVGAQTPTYLNHWEFFAEGLIGASGGGGYETNGGAIVEPVAGINYRLTPKTAIQLSFGHIMALKQHSTNNNALNAGMLFTFGAPAKA